MYTSMRLLLAPISFFFAFNMFNYYCFVRKKYIFGHYPGNYNRSAHTEYKRNYYSLGKKSSFWAYTQYARKFVRFILSIRGTICSLYSLYAGLRLAYTQYAQCKRNANTSRRDAKNSRDV